MFSMIHSSKTRAAALIAAAVTGAVFAPASLSKPEKSEGVHMITQSTSGSDTVKFERTDDKYVITLNGKEVKSGSYDKDDWDEYEVKSDKGDVVATLIRDGDSVSISTQDNDEDNDSTVHITTDNQAAQELYRSLAGSGRGLSRLRTMYGNRNGTPRAFAFSTGETPKVMLGVNLGTPDESLAQQIGVNPEEATLISTITKDLPADKAGLQKYDVIVKIDGKTPAGESDVRKVLREKNPGDTVSFEVVRKGEHKTFSVNLEAYDAAKLGGFTYTVPGQQSWNTFFNAPEAEQQAKAMAELAREMELKARESAKQAMGTDQKALRDLNEHMQKLAEEMAKKAEQWSQSGAWGGNWTAPSAPGAPIVITPRGAARGGAMLAVPTPAPTPMQPFGPGSPAPEASQELNDRLAQLDAKMEKLEALMAKLVEEKSASAAPGSAKNH